MREQVVERSFVDWTHVGRAPLGLRSFAEGVARVCGPARSIDTTPSSNRSNREARSLGCLRTLAAGPHWQRNLSFSCSQASCPYTGSSVCHDGHSPSTSSCRTDWWPWSLEQALAPQLRSRWRARPARTGIALGRGSSISHLASRMVAEKSGLKPTAGKYYTIPGRMLSKISSNTVKYLRRGWRRRGQRRPKSSADQGPSEPTSPLSDVGFEDGDARCRSLLSCAVHSGRSETNYL
jgi:hypothetical protein